MKERETSPGTPSGDRDKGDAEERPRPTESALAVSLKEADAARRLLSSLLDRVSDGFVALDNDWRYTYVNQKAAEMLQRQKPEDLIGRHIWTEYPEGVGQPFHQAYLKAVETQRPVVLEEHYEPWDRWFENRIYPSPDGLTIYFSEVTHRKRAEAAVRQAEERLRLAATAGKVGLWDWDLETNRVHFSPEWKRQIGYQDHEIIDDFEEWRTRVHPEDLERTLEEIKDYLAHPRPEYEVEFRLRHRNGSYRWIMSRGELIRDAAGHPGRRMLGGNVDVTERKHAEIQTANERAVLEALAKGESLPELLTCLVMSYQQMFPGTLASVLLLDADGRHVRHGAAPSLPEAYWRAIDGAEIGETAGSCGTAAYTRRTVVVSDIATDPLWRDYRDLALAHGLRACWSVPVISSDDRVLGTFALYYREPRAPEPSELAAVERGGRLASVAIERHQLFQALRQSERQLRLYAEHAPAAIAMFDREMRYLVVSRRWMEDYGLAEQPIIGHSHYEVFPEIPERWIEVHRRCLAGATEKCEEDAFVRADGSTQWIRWEARPWRLADGEIGGIVIFTEDITEGKRAEEALRERTQQLEMALRGAGLGLWHWDFPSDSVTTLKGAGPISGLPAADYPASGEAFKTLVHAEDRAHVAAQIERAVGSQEDYEAEFRIVVPSTQAVRWVSARGRCLYDAEGNPAVLTGVDMDITERKRADLHIRQLNAELEQRVADRTAELHARTRELEAFAYSVSHDLKAPLRGIDGYSRLLIEDYAGKLDAEGRGFLHNIRHASTQMSRLIDDLLAYSRLERRPLQAMQVDLPALAQSLLADRADELRARGVLASLEVPAMAVSADRQGLALALRNLIDNALKFTADVGQPRIEIGGQAGERACLLWVRDNGIGFEMRFHDRIFEVFQRLQRSEDYPGTGIGLAMVRKAMERMGGRVWAESEPGRGATFFLEIPR